MGESLTALRVSYGTAIELGLIKGLQRDPPTTAYFLLINDKCQGKCKFCPQSKGLTSKISRITWLEFEIDKVIDAMEKMKMKRICLQLTDEENIVQKAKNFILKMKFEVPISISAPPLLEIFTLKDYIDILTIPIDCANEKLFKEIKGRDWSLYWSFLKKALRIFGSWKVGTHIIVGLGESEKEIVKLLYECKNLGIIPSLFAFTPLPGIELSGSAPPNISSYRRLQLARELIFSGEKIEFHFDNFGRIKGIKARKEIIEKILEDGEAFMTRGCPDCNRPYFNERVSGVIYNYPRKLTEKEKEKIRRELFEGTESIEFSS